MQLFMEDWILYKKLMKVPIPMIPQIKIQTRLKTLPKRNNKLTDRNIELNNI